MIKLKDILLESDIFIPRRVEDRKKRYIAAIQKRIQDYINNGSNGNLDLSNTPIEKLPDNLTKVRDNLDLNNSHIQSLPDGLFVGWNLYLQNSHTKRLPDGLKVGHYLNLYNTLIKELPDNLIVGGSLTANSTKLEKLPIGLKVMGDFHIMGTPLSQKYTKEELIKLLPGVDGNIIVNYD